MGRGARDIYAEVNSINITQNVGKEARSIHISNSIRVWEGR